MTRTLLPAATLVAALLAAGARAEERIVHANVVRVEPVTAETGDCSQPKPSRGLAALLDWDLATRCTTESHGYRVYYRWDDRTYSKIFATRPDATVPLVLNVD